MIVTILDIGVAGLLLGGLYAIIAMGLSLQYGVARVLNISHGEFIMLGAFATWSLYTFLGISPLLSLVICGPALFIIGFFIHRTIVPSTMAMPVLGMMTLDGMTPDDLRAQRKERFYAIGREGLA